MRGNALDPDNESQLWSRFCKDDRAAFDIVYATYFPILFQYCFRFTTDRSLIKDVLQDFFLTTFIKPPRGAAVQHVKSYLLVAVRRQLFKALRNAAVTENNLTEEGDYDFQLELAADSFLIEKQTTHNRDTALQHIINGLTPRQREAVYLYFFENISYEQIAVILSLKEVKYARTLIYRALEEMREVLSGNHALTEMIRNKTAASV